MTAVCRRIHLHHHRHARAQPLGQWLVRVDGNADRQALYHFGEVAAGVVRTQHAELRAGGRGDLLDVPVQLFTVEGIHLERGGLADQLRVDIEPDRVYIFTPDGHAIDLPKGATPLQLLR